MPESYSDYEVEPVEGDPFGSIDLPENYEVTAVDHDPFASPPVVLNPELRRRLALLT